MQTVALGVVRVPTPGTPVPITTDLSVRVMQVVFRTVPGFTGKTYIGLAGMNKSSANMTGVVRILSEPPAFGPQDGESIPPSPNGATNVVRLADFWIDADVANEGVVVSYFVG